MLWKNFHGFIQKIEKKFFFYFIIKHYSQTHINMNLGASF